LRHKIRAFQNPNEIQTNDKGIFYMLKTKTEMNMKTRTQDERIAAGILLRLQWDARVSLADVTILAQDRKVTVAGDFDRDFRRKAVLSIVKEYPGVREVDDRTSVRKAFVRTDEQLQSLLHDEIRRIPLDGTSSSIYLEVVNGTANFYGHVNEPRVKALASRLAWELSGIRDCNNRIRVMTPGQPHVHALAQTPMSDQMNALAV
jgi:osmotically-inducible protein OsmY